MLDDLLLTKEEIPIIRETRFSIPIHPSLVDTNVTLDPNLAQEVFPQAVEEWHEDLAKYVESPECEEANKRWIKESFISKKPILEKHYDRFKITNIAGWESNTQATETGFVFGLSVSRNAGGTIYFVSGDSNCRDSVYMNRENKGPIRLDPNKAKEFVTDSHGEGDGMIGRLFAYAHHNIDHRPGATMMRNWGLAYINKALCQILG